MRGGSRRRLLLIGLSAIGVAGVLLAVAISLWRAGLSQRYAPSVIVPGAPVEPLPQADFSQRKVVRVLTVDGGGVRGLIPAEVLAYLEQKTGRPTADLFDLFVGTSSGGIVTAACLMPGPDGRPRYTAEQVGQSFQRLAPRVFSPPLRDRLLTLDGVLGPKYSSEKKFDALRDEFGLAPFGSLLKPAIMTAYDMLDERPGVLANWLSEWANYSVPAILSAGTTVPGVFNPVLLVDPDGRRQMYTDEGVIENDPSAVALEFLREFAPRARVVIVNLGTGRFLMNAKSAHPYSQGELRWLSDLLPYLESSNVQVTERSLLSQERYLGTDRLVYVSINIDMPAGHFYHPFNASAENLANIRALGEKCVEKNRAKLDQVASLLVNSEN